MISAATGDDIDLTAVVAALLDQEAHGHNAVSDGERSLYHFQHELVTRAQSLDVVLPGDRQNLDVALRRTARLAAFAISTMRRIRLEQGRAQ
jgi:hypothetical protein